MFANSERSIHFHFLSAYIFFRPVNETCHEAQVGPCKNKTLGEVMSCQVEVAMADQKLAKINTLAVIPRGFPAM